MSFTPRGPRESLDPHTPMVQGGSYVTFVIVGLIVGIVVSAGLGYLLRYFYFTGIVGAAMGLGLGLGAQFGWRFAPRNIVTYLIVIVMGLVVFGAHHFSHYQLNHGDEAWSSGQMTSDLKALQQSDKSEDTSSAADPHQQFEEYLISQVEQGGFTGYIRWRLDQPTAPIRPWASEYYFGAKGTRILVLVDLIALLIVALWLGPEVVRSE